MELINAQTGQPEDILQEDVAISLANGTHLPPSGQGVLVNPQNELVFTPASQVTEAVEKYGFKIPEPDELRTMGESFKFNKPEYEALAAGAGLARGATLGVSDFLLTRSGAVSPETLRKAREYSPGISLTAELTGGVGTAFIPGAPVAQVVKGAKAAEAATAGFLASGLGKLKMGQEIAKIAAETGAKGLGGAIEGLAFGLGQTVSEAALGDPDLTAEKAMSNLGQGAFIGGALNAALVPGGILLRKSLDGAKKAYQGIYEKLVGKFEPVPPKPVSTEPFVGPGGVTIDPADEIAFVRKAEVIPPGAPQIVEEIEKPLFKAQEEATEQFVPGILTRAQAKLRSTFTGETENEIINAVKNTQKNVYMTAAQQDEVARDLQKSISDLWKKTDQVSRKTSGPIRQKEMENLLVGAPVEPAVIESQKILNNGFALIKNMSDDATAYRYDQGVVKDINVLLQGFQKNAETFTEASQYYKAINELKQIMDEISLYGKKDLSLIPRAERNAVLLAREFGTEVRKSLVDENIWGQTAARQSAYNEAIKDFIDATGKGSWFRKYFMEKMGNKYVVTATKTKQFIRFVNDVRGISRNQGLEDFLNTSKKLIDQVDLTYQNVPQEKIDIKALKDFVYKASDTATASRDFAASHAGGLGFVTDAIESVRQGGITGAAADVTKGFLSGIADPSATVSTLSAIEKMAAATSKAINKTSKIIFEKARPLGKAFGILKDQMTTEEKKQKYQEIIKKMNDLSMNQEGFINEIEKSTENSFQHAPKISQAMQETAIRGLSFLATKVPVNPHAGPLDKEQEPSFAQISKFMRYHTAVENPLVILKEIEANKILPETIEALDNVYPKLLSEIKATLLGEMTDQLAKGPIEMDYQKRVVLSKFLGISLDSSLRSNVLAANQVVLRKLYGEAKEKEAQEQAVQRDIANVSLAERTKNKTENVITRA